MQSFYNRPQVNVYSVHNVFLQKSVAFMKDRKLYFLHITRHINHKEKNVFNSVNGKIQIVSVLSTSRLSFAVHPGALRCKSVNILSHFGSLISLWHNLFILESVAELRVPEFQAALTVHDIDADSAMGVSIITDDRRSCTFSDDKEVS